MRQWRSRFAVCLFFFSTSCISPLPSPVADKGLGLYEVSSEPLEMEFLDLDGKVSHLSDFRGHPVVLTFWATWCFSCQADLRSLNELQKYFGNDLRVIAVAVSDSETKVRSFQRSNGIRFPVFLDPDEKAFHLAGGEGMLPYTVVLDKQGRLLRFPDPETSAPSPNIQGPRRWDSQKVVRSLEAISH